VRSGRASRNRRSRWISRRSALEENDFARLPISADPTVIQEAKDHAVLKARGASLNRSHSGLATVGVIVNRVVYTNVFDTAPRDGEIGAIPVSTDAPVIVESKHEFAIPLKSGHRHSPIGARDIERWVTDAKVFSTTGFEREVFAIPVSAHSAVIFEAKNELTGVIDPEDRDFAIVVRNIDCAIADANVAIAISVRRESRSPRDRKRET
jgi:hypothetical protein